MLKNQYFIIFIFIILAFIFILFIYVAIKEFSNRINNSIHQHKKDHEKDRQESKIQHFIQMDKINDIESIVDNVSNEINLNISNKLDTIYKELHAKPKTKISMFEYIDNYLQKLEIKFDKYVSCDDEKTNLFIFGIEYNELPISFFINVNENTKEFTIDSFARIIKDNSQELLYELLTLNKSVKTGDIALEKHKDKDIIFISEDFPFFNITFDIFEMYIYRIMELHHKVEECLNKLNIEVKSIKTDEYLKLEAIEEQEKE